MAARRLRPTRAGVVGGLVYLVLALGWALLDRPAALPLYAAWFVALAAFGVFVPGAANHVTLARAYLAAPALASAVSPGGLGLLAVTVAVAGLTDLVDGTIARRFDKPSNFGGGLDPIVDGLFLGAVALGLAAGGAFPFWLALVVVARYLAPAAVGAGLIATGRSPELRHTLTGQVSTTLILVLLGGIALFRGLGQASDGLVNAAQWVIPIATVATFAHLAWASRQPAPT